MKMINGYTAHFISNSLKTNDVTFSMSNFALMIEKLNNSIDDGSVAVTKINGSSKEGIVSFQINSESTQNEKNIYKTIETLTDDLITKYNLKVITIKKD